MHLHERIGMTTPAGLPVRPEVPEIGGDAATQAGSPWPHRVGRLKARTDAAVGVLRLLRPLNCAMLAVGVGVGGVLAAGDVTAVGGEARRLLLAALSVALIGGGANSINDVFDLEIDRLNRPSRPLPSGRVGPGTARVVWLLGTVAGVALSLWVSAVHVAIAIGAAVLLFAYSAWLKRMPLAGNLVVSLAIGLALVYGGWAIGTPGPALVGALFAFLTTLAREIVKDVQDVAGDTAAGARTLPLVYGVAPAARVVTAVLIFTAALTPAPFLWLDYSSLYLLLVLVADLLIVRAVWLLQDAGSGANAARASAALKWAMVAGLAALAAAGAVE